MTPYKSEEHYLPLVLEALSKDPVKDYKVIKGAMHLMLGGEILTNTCVRHKSTKIFNFSDKCMFLKLSTP